MNTWHPDEELLTQTCALVRTSDPANSEVALDVLQAVGTLAFLEEDAAAHCAITNVGIDPKAIVTVALEALDHSELDRAAIEIPLLADDLRVAEDNERPAVEEQLLDAISVRDRFALILEGARCLLGHVPELSVELESSIASFDEVVGAELWRVLPLGERRAARCAWASPAKRRALWWWHKGSHLPWTALDDMSTVAELLYLFPQARAELEALITATKQLEELERGQAN